MWATALGASACVSGGVAPRGPRHPELAHALLATTGTAAVELVLDLDWYFSDRAGTESAELALGATRAAIEISRIGGSSLALCRWRKLRLTFGDQPTKRLYLTPHCNDADTSAMGALQSDEQLYGQALANRVLAVLDIPALETRLVSLRWIDRDHPDRALIRPALLVEDVRDVARAIGGAEDAYQGPGRDGPLTELAGFDPGEVARFHLFQTLINNRDWRAFQLEPLGRTVIGHQASPLHNVFALDPTAGRPVLIPLDLDASTFAAVPRSVADVTGGADETLLALLAAPELLAHEPPLVRWMVLRVQQFRLAHDPRVAAPAIAHFVKQRPALEASVRAFEPLLPEPLRERLRARAAAHLDAFFRAISPPLWDLPRVARDGARLFAGPIGERVVCDDLGRGTPLVLGRTEGSRTEVRLGVRLRVGDGPTRPLCPGPDGAPLSGWLDAGAISGEGGAP